jgi:hypothetical protein
MCWRRPRLEDGCSTITEDDEDDESDTETDFSPSSSVNPVNIIPP